MPGWVLVRCHPTAYQAACPACAPPPTHLHSLHTSLPRPLQSRKGPGSQPASRHGTPEPAAMSDDQAHLLAAAANRLGGEDEEVSSGAAAAPEAAAADLKG